MKEPPTFCFPLILFAVCIATTALAAVTIYEAGNDFLGSKIASTEYQ